MKIYLTDQSKNFPKHLDELKLQPVIQYDISKLTEKTTIVKIDTDKSFHQLNTSFFFDYQIFPNNIMAFLTQWNLENRDMQIGDTIAQQAFIPPVQNFSQKIIFGVRINNVVNEENRIGFSYETLKGHLEKGISTFTIERVKPNEIIFKIHTFSKPGTLLTQLGQVLSVPYQTFCTKQALLNVKRQLES